MVWSVARDESGVFVPTSLNVACKKKVELGPRSIVLLWKRALVTPEGSPVEDGEPSPKKSRGPAELAERFVQQA